MVTFRLAFSDSEMEMFFRSRGLQVVDVTFVEHVPAYHNLTKEVSHTAKCVVNPHNRKTIPVSIAFEKVVLTAAKQLLLESINKIHVINTLNKEKNEY